MPIYEYRCSSCGHQKEFLQKVSDPPLTVCPQCGASTFSKMVTAAGFQLKGSGWYVTDFRNGSGNASKPAADAKSADAAKSESGAASADSKSADAKPADAKPAAAPAPAPAPAPSSAPKTD